MKINPGVYVQGIHATTNHHFFFFFFAVLSLISAGSSISGNPKDVQCHMAEKGESIGYNNLIYPCVFNYYCYVSFSSKIPSLASIVNDKNLVKCKALTAFSGITTQKPF